MSRDSAPARIFLLSPAHCGGKRATWLLRDQAAFPLAVRLREPEGIPLGEAFSFLSGLYFRGKLAYAARFGRPLPGYGPAQVITANRGLLPADTRVSVADLRSFGTLDIRSDDPRYREPLLRDITRIARDPAVEIVLLGSVATGKYVDVLLDAVGDRLLFPREFTGRGDMSRGALMLRAAREGVELEYDRIVTAVTKRSGTRG